MGNRKSIVVSDKKRREIVKEIGADGYGENATEAVRIAKELMKEKRSGGKAADAGAPVGAVSQSA